MKIVFLEIIIFLVFLSNPAISSKPGADLKKTILVVHSYHHGFKWTDDISQAIEDVFFDKRDRYDINFEYMDSKRIYNQKYINLTTETFIHKYENKKIDVIITSDDNALNLVLQLRESIFKDVPIVFCGKNYVDPVQIRKINNITGVNEAAEIKENIQLIKKLQPLTKSIYIIVENTTTGNIIKKEIGKVVTSFKELDFTVYSETGVDDLIDSVKNIPSNSVLLYTLFMRDSNNVPFESYEIMKIISENSKVPVYGTWDFNLGFGIVGGKLTSGYIEGKEAASMALKILTGTPADSIPIIMASPNKYMFDYNELKRFHINEDMLPENSIIINKTESYFSDNKSFLIKIIVIFLFLLFIIGLLLTNIHKRRKAEISLKKSEERYRSVYENSAIGIFKIGMDKNLLLANPAFISMLGFKSFNELKDRIYQTSIGQITAAGEKIFEHFQTSTELKGYEVETQKNDGSSIFLRLNIRQVFDENNEQVLEGFAEDITESKAAEEAITRAKDQAEKSDKLKTEFLAQMSHEIRTPINTILSFTSLLKDSINLDKDDDLYDSFHIIHRAGKRIIRTVNLLLDMSQIQTGTFETNFSNVSVAKEILEPLYLEFFKLAKEKGIELQLNIKSVDDEIFTDEYTLMQIFHNLIDNAIKYTSKGFINLLIYNPAAQNKLCVEIQDSGIGISEEYLPYLFEPFTQEEQGYTRKFEGNGLGLALVKKYCELVKAEITVESTKGKGTTFRVTFCKKMS